MLPHSVSFLKLPVFLLVYVSVSTGLAQVYNSSISVGAGRTGRASVAPADSFLLNPATMVHLKGRQLFASGAEDEFAAALSDNTKGSFFPAAFGYVQKKTEIGGTDMKFSAMSLGIAEFGSAKFAMGITAHYYSFDTGVETLKQFNGDVGFIYTPAPAHGVALVVYNVMGERDEVPEALVQKTSVGIGYNYVISDRARFRLDATSEEEAMAGVENYLNDFIITRIGYSNNFEKEYDRFHAGLGFIGPRFALNYAYEVNLKESGEYRHSVDLGIPF